jgi:hypothetical protein
VWETLVGGLIAIAAGLVGFAGSYWTQTQQWRREDEAVRREVYAEFILRWTLYEEAKRDFQQLEPGSPQKNEEAKRVLLRTFNALSLIAPEEVRAAAVAVVEEEEGAPGRFWEVARKDLGKWPSRWRRMVGS